MRSVFISFVVLSLFVSVGLGVNKGSILGFNIGLDAPEYKFVDAAQTCWAWQANANDYSSFIPLVQLAKKYKLKVLAVCLGSPASMSGVTDSSDKYPPLPQHYSDFANYCAGFVKNGADAVEIWNEPNWDVFWKPNRGGVDIGASTEFGNLVIATYPVIKAANPNALVITGGLANGGYYNSTDPYHVARASLKYAQRLFQIPKFATSFDGFGVHPYQYGNGATPQNGEWGWNMWAELPQFHQLMVTNGVGNKGLWLTEFGCPSSYVGETEADQALIYSQYLTGLDNFRTQNNVPVAAAFIYELQDTTQFQGVSMEGYFGLHRPDRSHKPAAALVASWSSTAIPPSPSGTIVRQGSGGSIRDANGNVWSITSDTRIAVNGVADTTTIAVLQLAYINGVIWQENGNYLWWHKSAPTDTWLPVNGDPKGPFPTPAPH